MDDLLAQFLIEGRDLVAEAHGALLALGRDAEDRAALDSLFRAAHTLKGSVALFDMAPAEALLHAAESRLDQARKDKAALDAAALDHLVAVIDQTDRWIDAMDGAGALDAGAGEQSRQLIAMLAGESAPPAAQRNAPPSDEEGDTPDWLAALRATPAVAALQPGRAVTAFRYAPDAECFFRGEDPLAMAAAVPDLLSLAVLPADEGWPDLAQCEPFRCMAVLEGVSGAEPEAVRTAFRLVPDQVTIRRIVPAPVNAVPRQAQGHEAARTLRVDAAKLDRLADQSGELGTVVGALAPLADRLHRVDPQLAAELRSARDAIERVAGGLRRSVAQLRLVPLEPVLRRLPRLAREAAASLGKPMRFALEGENSQVDKHIADQLFEPLLHLVRNAIDHGLETGEERRAKGKQAEGDVRLTVRQDGDSILIVLSDDGRGIDPAQVRRSAVAKSLIAADTAEVLDDADALDLLFLPGFSTAARATSLSGRGVGLDAVRAAVERMAGTIAIDSSAEAGTRIALRLPANAITTPLLIVTAGEERLGIRLDQIVETTRIAADGIHPVAHGRACVLRETTVPVLDLAQLLGLGECGGAQARLVVTDAGPGRTALRVGSFGERIDAVVRTASGLLGALPAVAGTTMMPDGTVLLILDLTELLA